RSLRGRTGRPDDRRRTRTVRVRLHQAAGRRAMVRRLMAGFSKKPALGPRGRGIFDRLFGGGEGTTAAGPREEATVVAVGSGKGGTGKSFLATNLAVLLHQSGRRVTLVDCDFGLACDHLLLGVTPQRTLQH